VGGHYTEKPPDGDRGNRSPFPPPPIEPQPSNPLIQLIYDLLVNVFQTGKTTPQIDIVTLTTGGAFQNLVNGQVKKAIIQNISSETVTILTSGGTQGVGILLDPKGSLPVGNVDLNYFQFVRTTAGVTLAVYKEA